jgi:hypothetical protein
MQFFKCNLYSSASGSPSTVLRPKKMEKNHDSLFKAFDLPGVFEKPFLREHVLSLQGELDF